MNVFTKILENFMKHISCKLLFVILCTCGFASNPISLSSIYADALAFDTDLETSKALLKQSKGLRAENYYNFVPAPLLSYDMKHSESTYKDGAKRNASPNVLTAAISQSVSATKIFNTISANKAVGSAQASLNSEHSVLLNSVITQYATILSNYETLVALKAQASYLKKVYDQEKEKFRLGASTKASVAQAKTSYDVVIAQLVDAKLQINTGLNQLFAITGVNYSSLPVLSNEVLLDKTFILKDLSFYKSSTLEDNDNLKASKLNLESTQNLLYSARSIFLPYITYSLTYTNNHDQSDYLPSQTIEESTLGTVGVALNFANNPGIVIEQQGEFDAAVAANRSVVVDTLTQLSSAYESVLASKESVRRYENAVNSAQISLKATQASYNAGTMTLLDVLDSIQELKSNQTSLAQKRYEYLTYYAQLRILSGESPTSILKNLDATTQKSANLRNISI